ncbi:MAG: hypothetical protein J5685_07640 [Clostridiales bacterium]|nr:hypothetical protein [Clostridiales bacterium]
MKKNDNTAGTKSAVRMPKLKDVIDQPVKLTLLLVPIVLELILGISTMGISDTLHVLRWILLLMIFGLTVLPLSCYIFKNSKSGGFFMSQPLGLLTTGLIVWTFSHIRIMQFNRIFIIATMILICAFCYWFKPFRENLIDKLSKGGVIENIAIEESVFVFILTLMCFYKGFLPDINGQEKFMDYGFIMSMLRSTRLPANDMWLSGHSINYYYFGQYLYALMIKLGAIKPSIGYTLSMCSALAIPFGMCFCLGISLVNVAKKAGAPFGNASAYITGTLAGLTTVIFGNSHSFFYDENGFGNRFLPLFASLGCKIGRTTDYFYPDSTRYIGYNPVTLGVEGYANGGDATIEEFPFYSYLVGDLHAHVVSTMVVLLIAAIALEMVASVIDMATRESERYSKTGFQNFNLSEGIIRSEYKRVITPLFITASILLGCAQMTNYWDFLIYFIFLSMTLLIVNTRRTYSFSNISGGISFAICVGLILGMYLIAGERPFIHILLQLVVLMIAYAADVYAPCSLSRTSLGMSFMFTVAHIVALPFNATFDMISNKIAACVNHTPLYQLYILYGTHVIITVTFLIFTIVYNNYEKAGKTKVRRSSRKNGTVNNIIGYREDCGSDPVTRFFHRKNVADIFVCGMTVVGILLLIAPEIFYVRDIYTSGYLRSNTMFKFTYAAFIILSISMAYAIVRMYYIINKKGEYSSATFILGIVFSLMLIVPAHYTGVALKQRSGDLDKANYKTLDGTAYIQTYTSPNCLINETGNLRDYENAIEWLNANVVGSPVLMEAYGDSYTDNDIVSAYTGLPSVFGWQTHEWLWRFHGIVDPDSNLLISDPEQDVWKLYITPRHNDINTFYTTNDPSVVQSIIDTYNVEYVVIGDMERAKFGVDNTPVIEVVGDCVFSSGTLKIFKVTPSSQS